jgi:hypothetical protein
MTHSGLEETAPVRWLITLPKNANLEKITQRLASLGTRLVEEEPPIPLGEDEQVVSVVGPADLGERLAGDEAVLAIYPDSEYELY